MLRRHVPAGRPLSSERRTVSGLLDNLALVVPLLACVGMHLALHRLTGKSCHGEHQNREAPAHRSGSGKDVGSDRKFPICNDPKFLTLGLSLKAYRAALLALPTERPGARMYKWETRMLLKHYLDRGVSKAELSRRFGVNRRTIHNWVDTGQLDRDLAAGARGYSPRPPVAHKLDPYKAIIDARLEAFPKLSAQRLFDEVRAADYPGCYSRVNDYVRARRPREPVESLVRFETPAGRQGQVDFGTFTLPWGRRHALVIVLGYSRLLWLHFYTRQTMPVLMEGLESAFDRFGGVPEELLFDQMRAVVLSDDRGAGGGLVLNEEFLRFAAHWGFMPRSCRPYRAQTKGKVERPIRYIRESFFYGRSFANDNDLNEQAVRWLEGTANVRRHATTGERPVDRFERDERAVLLPLANHPYRRLGVRHAPEPAPRRLPATVKVEQRPLSVYAEALQ